MKTLSKLTLGFVLLATAGLAAAAEEKPQTVQATGEAAIVGTDAQAKVKARAEAKRVAQRNAVESVAGTMISAYSLTRDNVLVSDRVFSNAQGYVKNVRDEKYEEKDGVVTYSATMDVSTAGIDKDLAAIRQLVKSLEGKKMVLVIQEQTFEPGGAVIQGGALTEVLNNSFKSEGWTMIDPAFLSGKLKVAAAASMGAQEAKEVANLARADYVLYGQAAFRRHEFDANKSQGMLSKSPVYPVSGEYNLTVFATDTGTILGTLTDQLKWDTDGGALGKSLVSYERTTQNLIKAAQPKILGGVRKLIYSSLGDARQNGNRVVVEVNGLDDFDAAEDFRDVLKERKGVTDVGDLNFEDGTARYDVVLVGSTSDLARQFAKATFKKKKLKVTGKSNNRVALSVAK